MHRLVGRVLRERDQASGRWTTTLATALDMLEPHLFDESQAWGQRELGSELMSQIEALWEAATVEPPDRDIMARELGARSWGVRQLVAAEDLTRAIDLGRRVAADSERVLGPDHPRHPDRRATTSPAPTGRRGASPRRSRCTSTPSPTASGSWAPTTPTPWPHATTSPRLPVGGAPRRGDPAVRAHPHRPRAGPGPRPPRHPDLPQQPRRAPTGRRGAWRGDPAVRADPRRPRAGPGPRPPRHPGSRNNLAGAYRSAGRLAEAIALYEQTLADRERVLGPTTPTPWPPATTSPAPTGRRGAGARRSRCTSSTLTDRERVLGPDHPDTLASRNNLAGAYQSAGRLERGDPAVRAHPHRPRAGPGRRPPRHPDLTQRPRPRLRVGGRLTEAIALQPRTGD